MDNFVNSQSVVEAGGVYVVCLVWGSVTPVPGVAGPGQITWQPPGRPDRSSLPGSVVYRARSREPRTALMRVSDMHCVIQSKVRTNMEELMIVEYSDCGGVMATADRKC